MLKRFTKSGKKQNKSGVILITILFILAVAFILIGSALIMTAKTRNRLYTFAEGGQARLTCTAAAQLFENALQEQQINDKQFRDLCSSGTAVWFTDVNVPGMGGDHTGATATSPMPDNCTRAVFGQSGTKLTVRISTRIGDEVENILLTYEGTPEPAHTSPFAFQVELGEGGRLDKIDIGNIYGTSSRYDADDNLVVTRGSGSAPYDSCNFYSTFVTTHPMRSASGTKYYGDIVYAGADAGVYMTGGGTGAGAMMEGGGTAYFINCNQVFYGAPNADATHEVFDGRGQSTSQVIFCNTHNSGTAFQPFQCFTGFQAGSIYQIDYDSSSGAVTGTSHSIGFGGNDSNLFLADNSFTDSAATNKSLTYYIGNLDQYLSADYVDPTTGVARPSSYSEFVAQTPEASLTTSGSAPAGAATLSASGVNSGSVYKVSGNVTNMYNIDVSGNNVVVYLQGAVTISGGGGFVVSGGDGTNTSHKCYFIISRGGSITFSGDTTMGFFSSNCHASAITDPIIQTQAPIIYIIGAGTNHDAALDATGSNHGQISCNVNQNACIEAMVALYPYTDADGDAGDFYCMQGPSCNFYGRIIANTILTQNGSHMTIPYCPQFSSGEDPNQLYRARSAYTCTSFDYFYDDATSSTASSLHS